MTGGLLTEPDRKEGLSLVYVKALAVRAGFLTTVPGPDRDSVDLRIQAGGTYRPALELQLKATAGFDGPRNGFLPFRLPLKNYGNYSPPTDDGSFFLTGSDSAFSLAAFTCSLPMIGCACSD